MITPKWQRVTFLSFYESPLNAVIATYLLRNAMQSITNQEMIREYFFIDNQLQTVIPILIQILGYEKILTLLKSPSYLNANIQKTNKIISAIFAELMFMLMDTETNKNAIKQLTFVINLDHSILADIEKLKEELEKIKRIKSQIDEELKTPTITSTEIRELKKETRKENAKMKQIVFQIKTYQDLLTLKKNPESFTKIFNEIHLIHLDGKQCFNLEQFAAESAEVVFMDAEQSDVVNTWKEFQSSIQTFLANDRNVVKSETGLEEEDLQEIEELIGTIGQKTTINIKNHETLENALLVYYLYEQKQQESDSALTTKPLSDLCNLFSKNKIYDIGFSYVEAIFNIMKLYSPKYKRLSKSEFFLELNPKRNYNTVVFDIETTIRQMNGLEKNFKDNLIRFIQDKESGLHSYMHAVASGGGSVLKPKRTTDKVTLGSLTRTVYLGAKNKKFVKLNKQYIPLKDAQQQVKQQAAATAAAASAKKPKVGGGKIAPKPKAKSYSTKIVEKAKNVSTKIVESAKKAAAKVVKKAKAAVAPKKPTKPTKPTKAASKK